MSKTVACASLAAIVALATPASADLIFGDGWDLVDAGGYGAATQFTLAVPAYLEFTTVVGDDSTFDLMLLNTSCTSPLASVCWKDIGTTSQGIPYPGINPPDGEPTQQDFDIDFASPYASHGQWLISPGSWEAYASLDQYLPGETQGAFATFRLVAVPEPSTWALMLLGFLGLGYAALRSARASRPLNSRSPT